MSMPSSQYGPQYCPQDCRQDCRQDCPQDCRQDCPQDCPQYMYRKRPFTASSFLLHFHSPHPNRCPSELHLPKPLSIMCLPCCIPFADVYLEDPPKKKEEKKGEEKKEYVFVDDGAVFCPVSSTILHLHATHGATTIPHPPSPIPHHPSPITPPSSHLPPPPFRPVLIS